MFTRWWEVMTGYDSWGESVNVAMVICQEIWRDDAINLRSTNQHGDMYTCTCFSLPEHGKGNAFRNAFSNAHFIWSWTYHRSRLLCFWRKVPMAVEYLSQNGVVRLLSHRTFPASVKGWEIPSHHLHHALPGLWLLCDAECRKHAITPT